MAVILRPRTPFSFLSSRRRDKKSLSEQRILLAGTGPIVPAVPPCLTPRGVHSDAYSIRSTFVTEIVLRLAYSGDPFPLRPRKPIRRSVPCRDPTIRDSLRGERLRLLPFLFGLWHYCSTAENACQRFFTRLFTDVLRLRRGDMPRVRDIFPKEMRYIHSVNAIYAKACDNSEFLIPHSELQTDSRDRAEACRDIMMSLNQLNKTKAMQSGADTSALRGGGSERTLCT